jgi:hypothetical protein
MNYEIWMERGYGTICELKSGQKFELKSLYKGSDWDSLSRGDRIMLGKFFKNKVMDGHVEDVLYVDRANNNHALYEKK